MSLKHVGLPLYVAINPKSISSIWRCKALNNYEKNIRLNHLLKQLGAVCFNEWYLNQE